MKLNNINVDRVNGTVLEFKNNITKAKKVNKVEGEWNLNQGAQFRAVAMFENGKVTLTFLGGGGTQPGPMIYCLYGSAACYVATFATLCALEGVQLKKLRVVAESNIDFSKVFGLSDNPIAEKVKFTLHVESDAPADKIKELEGLSRARCPAVYCLTNPIPLETELKIG
ncbi:MAG: OsmC family protein [Deltaproteobacteria bacterium]|nr:OsmC family protein [Deltaproteobacteria bacterium]